MKALTGRSFWQEESYDHLVRHEGEFEKILSYIEENPVRAGLVRTVLEYPFVGSQTYDIKEIIEGLGETRERLE